MALWDISYNWMMDNEDEARLYKTVPDAPAGSHAISGINSASFPKQFAEINAISQSKRGPYIENFYKTEFWNSYYEQIISDDIAKRVFDASVNMGKETSIEILQNAINNLISKHIIVDGNLGPTTVNTINNLSFSSLVSEFINLRVKHYEDIISKNPSDVKYKTQWETRAKK